MKIVAVSGDQFQRYWELMKPQERFTRDMPIPNLMMLAGEVMLVAKDNIVDAEECIGQAPTIHNLMRAARGATADREYCNG